MGAHLLQRKASRADRFYVDMDGVLADYERGADEAGVPHNEFKDVPGCYLELPWMPGAKEAFTQLLAKYGGALYILSSPPSKRAEEAEGEKRMWLADNLPDFPEDHAIFTTNKALEGQPGDKLVDDHPDWNGAEEFPGEVIPYTGPETWASILGAKVAAAPSVDVNALAQEFMRFLDPEGRLPPPTIQIKDNAGSPWLGQCAPEGLIGAGGTCTSVHATIYLQKSLLSNPKDLKRVIAHEVAHYIAMAEESLGLSLADYNEATRRHNKEGGHGPQWLNVVRRINAAYGADYVTLTSDQSYTIRSKEVNLFIIRQDDRMDWCWSPQIPSGVVDSMISVNSVGDGVACFIGRTDDVYLVVPQAKATNASPKWATPWLTEQVAALEKVWEATPNHFADLASGVDKRVTKPREITWTLIMADPYREDSPRHAPTPSWLSGWRVRRPLTEAEKDTIGQLNAIGCDTRFTQIRGDEALFNTLPALGIPEIVHRRGIPPESVMLPEVQEQLLKAWPQGERPVKQKTAHLFTRQAAAFHIDDGPGSSAVVRADVSNRLGPDFRILVDTDAGGNLSAQVHVVPKGKPEEKPFVLHADYRESDLATASDLVLQIKTIINQEYGALAYPLRQAQQRKQLHDLLMEGNLTYQKVMADLIPNLTRRPAPRWNGWAGAKTSAPVMFPDAFIHGAVSSVVSGLQGCALSGSAEVWEQMVQARRAWYEVDLAQSLRDVCPGVLKALGVDEVPFSLVVVPESTGRLHGEAGFVLNDTAIVCNLNPLTHYEVLHLSAPILGWVEGSLRHELTHLLHMAQQGRSAYTSQKLRERKGNPAYPDAMDEVKAVSSTLSAHYREELAVDPSLSVEEFLLRNNWWERNQQDFSASHRQRIYKDLAYVQLLESQRGPGSGSHVHLPHDPSHGGKHREGAADGSRFGGGGSGGYPAARLPRRLIPREASVWDADTSRMHYREDAARVRQVQTTLRQRFQQLLDALHVQPGGYSMTLRQFLQRNPLTALFQSTDQSVRLMGNRVRQEVNQVLHQEFTPADIQQFKDAYGSNVTDWFTHKIIARTVPSATAGLRTARLSDPSLLTRYSITPEQLALAKAIDSGDYLEWVVRQMSGVKPGKPNLSHEEANAKRPTIRLPEDAEKIRKTLEVFTKLKRSPKFTGNKDINAYTPAELFTLVSQAGTQISQKDQVRERRSAAVVWTGQLEHRELGLVDVEVLKITDPTSAMENSGGPALSQEGNELRETNWCTTQESYAEKYTRDGQALWVIKVDGRNYAQLHNESGQLLDATDASFPELKISGIGTVILDPVVNGAYGKSGAFEGSGGYAYLDLATAPPEVLVRYYASGSEEGIPEDAMVRIQKDPRALAALVSMFPYYETSQDLDVIFSDLEATSTWAMHWLSRPRDAQAFEQGKLFARDPEDPDYGDLMLQKLQEAMALIAKDPDTSEKFIVDYLRLSSTQKAWGGGMPDTPGQPAWFQGLVASVKSSAGATYRLLAFAPKFKGLPEALVAKDYTLALRWYIGLRPRNKPWPALEEAILGHEDQASACTYLQWFGFTARGVAADDPLFNLALSKVPEDEKTMWEVSSFLSGRIEDYSKTLFPHSPFPENWSGTLFPAATDQIVWASANPHVLALWAAKVYQHDSVKLKAALEHLASLNNGQASLSYLEAAGYPETPLLEPTLLSLLQNGGSVWFQDIANYVMKNYAPDLKNREEVRGILERVTAGRQPEGELAGV